jgi:hypothetical protein
MKAIDVVKEYLKGQCEYAAELHCGQSELRGYAIGYRCAHKRVTAAPMPAPYPDRPCTMDDWKECPLNPASGIKVTKIRLDSKDMHSDAYVCRCLLCDNDFASYRPGDDICEDCK